MKLSFLGAAGTVTGSRYLLQDGQTTILVDCGLFQGIKRIREQNWQPFPFPAADIDAIILAHAHLDHSGYLPRLVREGFRGKIYCTQATEAIARILLLDSANLQESDARRANRKGYTKHHPAEPLYTVEEAQKTFHHFHSFHYHDNFQVGSFKVHFSSAGHILGSACIHITAADGKTITFSGDVGRPNDAVMRPPEPIEQTDFLVVESTYGDRLHGSEDPKPRLANIINQTAAHGGVVLIPAFAVGRAQGILHLLTQLRLANEIPKIPFYLDSPMAIDVTDVLCQYRTQQRLTEEECCSLCNGVTYVRDAEESKKLNDSNSPKVIIAGSGMLTGGRVLHHLRNLAGNHRNTLVIAGYQAEGTRGRALMDGASSLRIFGKDIRIQCAIESMPELSGHADYEELCQWLSSIKRAPQKVFITHGETAAAENFQKVISNRFGWNTVVPVMGQSFSL